MPPDFVIRGTPGRVACEVDIFDRQCRCVVVGNLDAYTASELEHLLSDIPDEIDRVTIDLTRVKWPDSSSLAVIEGFMRAVRQRGGRAQIAGTYGQLQRFASMGIAAAEEKQRAVAG